MKLPMHEADPYLGAVVHYRFAEPGGLRCLASSVTLLPDDGSQRVGLFVLTAPGDEMPGPFSVPEVRHSIQGEEFTWHWRHECYG